MTGSSAPILSVSTDSDVVHAAQWAAADFQVDGKTPPNPPKRWTRNQLSRIHCLPRPIVGPKRRHRQAGLVVQIAHRVVGPGVAHRDGIGHIFAAILRPILA